MVQIAVDGPEYLQPNVATQDCEDVVYKIGDRVFFVAIFNDPGYMKPGDKIPGTIISVFEAAGIRIHRIELDIRWSRRRHPQYDGRKMVVGNIFARYIRMRESE